MSGQAEPLAEVFCTTGVRTSAGCAVGPKTLPASEAARLVAAKLAVYGSRPPHGFDDGGNSAATVAASKVFGGHSPRPAENVAASN